MNRYRVKVKKDTKNNDWSFTKTCRLQISVGMEYHNGEKFKAVLKWADRKFENIIINVGDTIQRYNQVFLKPELFENNFQDQLNYEKQLSKIEGAKWLEKEFSQINEYAHKITIRRWNDWLENPEYSLRLNEVKHFYEVCNLFKAEVDEAVEAYIQRKVNRNELTINTKYDELYKNASKLYIIEEISAFLIMFNEDNAIDIYPGSLLPLFDDFKFVNSPDLPKGLNKSQFMKIQIVRV